MISVENVTKKYGRAPAIEEISFHVENSSIYGLIGYNGAGKTTLLKTIAGIFSPETGRVCIDGQPVYDNEDVKRQMFMMTEEPFFLPQATLGRMRWFYKGYYPGWNDKTYKKLLSIFELDAHEKISCFSKGMQRQAHILLALSAMPRFLLLDESFDGLDLAKRTLVARLLRKYVREKEAVAVVTSHNLRELEGIADNIGMIKDRKLFFNASVSEMKERCKKYRMVLDRQISKEDITGVCIRKLHRDGCVYSFIADGDSQKLQKNLSLLGAERIEVFPVTLEEFFANEKEDRFDDSDDLF